MESLPKNHIANQKEMVIGKNSIQSDIPANFPRPKNGLYQILRKDVINIVRPIRPEWINKAVKTHNTAILQLYRENCALKEANEAFEKDMRLIKGMFPDIFTAHLDEESSEEDKPEEKVIIESKIQVVDEKKIGFFGRLLKKKPTQFVGEEVKPKMKEPKEKKGIFNGFKTLLKSVVGKEDHDLKPIKEETSISQEPPLIKTASIKEESNLKDDDVNRTKVVELKNRENTKQARPPKKKLETTNSTKVVEVEEVFQKDFNPSKENGSFHNDIKTDPIRDDDIVYDEMQPVKEIEKKEFQVDRNATKRKARPRKARQSIEQKVAIEKERSLSSKAEQQKIWKWAYRNGRWIQYR